MDGIRQRAKQPNLISLYRGSDGGTSSTRIFAAKSLDGPFRCS